MAGIGDPVFLVKNLGRVKCRPCGNVHEYISRSSDNAKCGTPIGYSQEEAEAQARAFSLNPEEAVIRTPDDTYIVLDDSARKLKRQASAVVLDQQLYGVGTPAA